jgi:hypothetical protein
MHVKLMQRAGVGQLYSHLQDQVLAQHGNPALAALATAHDQLAALELHGLDTQALAIEQAHASAAEQRRHQSCRARQHGQQLAHFGGVSGTVRWREALADAAPRSAARCVGNASTSATPMSRGWWLP